MAPTPSCPYRVLFTVNALRLDSFLPSAVQIAPMPAQSVVCGSTMVTVALESGKTVICQRRLLGLSRRFALITVPRSQRRHRPAESGN